MFQSWPEFEQPGWLALLPFVVALVWWQLRRRPTALPFPDTSIAATMQTGRGRLARWAGALGRGLALAALVIALAGPRWPDEGSRIPTEGVAILLVVDVSNSMNEQDFLWEGAPMSRIQAMKRAFRQFVAGGSGLKDEAFPGRPNDLVGLVTFTRRPKNSCPLTLSHNALLDILDREESSKGGHDVETNVGDAIAWGIHRLNTANYKHKVMLLVTDGEQGAIPDGLKPKQAAHLAAHYDIPIVVIDPGNDAVLASKSSADKPAAESRIRAKETMIDVVSMTGGGYYAANDSNGLLDALTKLSERLDRFNRQEIETFRYRKYWEGYAWLISAGISLWCGLLMLEFTVWRRFP